MMLKRSSRLVMFLVLLGLCMACSIVIDPVAVHVQDKAAQDEHDAIKSEEENDSEEEEDADEVEDQDEEGDTEDGDTEDGDTEDGAAEEDDTEQEGAGMGGKSAYTLDISTTDFVKVVDNPYFPLIPGSRWVYEAKLVDGTTERIELEILSATRQVNGVAATILHDSAFADGALIEETFDWYAQDQDGNVWYLGEDVDNYENGLLVDHAGSWEWGVDGALPGVYMWADPLAHLDEAYYQEYYPGVAEDQGKVLSVSENVTVPVGSFEKVVQTYDFSAMDPSLQEQKFYAPGVGVIREVDLNTGEEAVLIEYAPVESSATPSALAARLSPPTR